MHSLRLDHLSRRFQILLRRQRVAHLVKAGRKVAQHDRTSLGRQGQGMAATLAVGASRDDGDLSTETITHGYRSAQFVFAINPPIWRIRAPSLTA